MTEHAARKSGAPPPGSGAAPVADAIDRFLFMAIKAVGDKGGDVTFQATASTESIDRHGDMIKPSAFEKTAEPFLQNNPVLLAAHMHRSSDGSPTVVGSVTSLCIKDKRVEMAGVITGATTLGREWGALVRDKHVRAVSIGFIPLESVFDGEVSPGKTVEVFTEIELLEISLVSVPANAEALIRAMNPHALHARALSPGEAERFRANWSGGNVRMELLKDEPIDFGFDARFKALETALKEQLDVHANEVADRVMDRLVAVGLLEDHEAESPYDGRGGDGETRGVGTGDEETVGPAFETKDIKAACATVAGVANDTRK